MSECACVCVCVCMSAILLRRHVCLCVCVHYSMRADWSTVLFSANYSKKHRENPAAHDALVTVVIKTS